MAIDNISLRDIVIFVEEKGDLGQYDYIKPKIDILIEQISDSVRKKGILNFSEELLEKLFSIRMTLLNDSSFVHFFTSEIKEILGQVISDQFNTKPTYINLEKNLVQSIAYYTDINTSLKNREEIIQFITTDPPPSEEDFKEGLNSLSTTKEILAKNSFTTSLILEYTWLTSDLILSTVLEVSKDERKSLIRLIRDSTELYAAYLAALGFWSPKEDDETPWTRNIKILTSHLTSLIEPTNDTTVSTNQLEKIFTDL